MADETDDLDALDQPHDHEPADADQADPTQPPGSVTAERRRGGCLVPLAVFLLMAVVGYGAAKAIRGNDDKGLAQTFTLDRGTAGSQRWELKGVIDEQDDQCVFLYVGADQVTGGCDTEASRARIDDQTLVLGLAPETSATAQVRLSDGSTRRVPTQADDNLRRRWFITQKAGRLELSGPVVFYDDKGVVVA